MIALTQMLPITIVDGLASVGQTQRRVNRDKIGFRLIDNAQDLLITIHHLCARFHPFQDTYAGRTARRPSQIDANNDNRFVV